MGTSSEVGIYVGIRIVFLFAVFGGTKGTACTQVARCISAQAEDAAKGLAWATSAIAARADGCRTQLISPVNSSFPWFLVCERTD